MEPIISQLAVTWGRKGVSKWQNSLAAILIITCCPLLTIYCWVALERYKGSLQLAAKVASHDPLLFLKLHFPQPTLAETLGYAAWVIFQGLLYAALPGTIHVGQRTPGGHLLRYCTNGLLAWALSHVLFFSASAIGLIDPALVARHWAGLLVLANAHGFVLSGLAQLKGYYLPTFPNDCKRSGSLIFDFFGGVELNPRIGSWDVKFFYNGRPGIVAWTLIDYSWAAYQYQTTGTITGPMLVVLILHTMYVVDFFYNEAWYTRTIDISHDHFGFMLAWGDTTFLPSFYTLQAQYLARYPSDLSSLQTLAVLALGLSGYALFRSSNHQRYYVREQYVKDELRNIKLWGRPVEVIHSKYVTLDGKEHKTILLASGWWGQARHVNYLADLIQSWAMCAACGFTHLLPWFYFIFMTILLSHRARRDERRCRNKYGEKWEEYCRRVPYRIIPGVF